MDDQPNFVTSPFDVIRHLEGERGEASVLSPLPFV
jgi:hypothetical protein